MSVVRLARGQLDLSAGVFRAPGEGDVALTPREVDLLRYLVARAGTAVSNEELLTQVWGYNARVQSRAPFSTVSRLRQKLELDPRHPTHLVAVPGIGYRFEPVAAEPVTFGREALLDEIAVALRGAPLVTLRGPPGVGKSHLGAVVAARRPAGQVVTVGLAEARTVGDARLAVVARLSLGAEDEEVVGAALARPGLLVVLDNVEQIVTELGEVIDRWVEAGARFLCTSRIPLSRPYERVVAVPPLSVEAARRLFLHHASEVSGGPEVERLVERLDGIPLAVKLAARRTTLLHPREIASRLDRCLELLDGPARVLTAAIEGSWTLLDPDAQRALARLTVIQGSFDVAFAEEVIGVAALDALQALVEASLLVREEGEIRILATIRAFARERLAPEAAVDARDRHAQAMLRRLSDDPWARRHLPDLDLAIEHALAAGDGVLAAELLVAGARCLRSYGLFRRLIALSERVLAHPLPPRAASRLLAETSMSQGHVGGPDRGLEALERADALVPDDPELLAAHAARRGALLLHLHRLDEAEAELRRGLALCRAHALTLEVGLTLGNLGVLAKLRGEWRQAEACYSEALDVFEELGDEVQIATIQRSLGALALDEGRLDEAEHHLVEAIDTYAALDRPFNYAVELGNLGEVLRRRGEVDRAAEVLQDSVERLRALGERGHQSTSLAMLGETELQRGRPREALGHLMEAQRLARLAKFDWVVAYCETLRARVLDAARA